MQSKNSRLQKLWSDLKHDLTGEFRLDDSSIKRLILVMRHVPDLRQQAWKRFLNPRPDKTFDQALTETMLEDLGAGSITASIDAVFGPLKPEPPNVLRVMEEVPELRQEVWDFIVKEDYTSLFRQIMEKFPEFRERAWEQLLNHEPEEYGFKKDFDLRTVMEKSPELAEQAWQKLQTIKMDGFSLCCLMEKLPTFRQRAWERLLAQGAKNFDLIRVMEKVPDLKVEAKNLLLQRQMDANELYCLMESFPELRGEAQKRLIQLDDIIRKMVDICKE